MEETKKYLKLFGSTWILYIICEINLMKNNWNDEIRHRKIPQSFRYIKKNNFASICDSIYIVQIRMIN